MKHGSQETGVVWNEVEVVGCSIERGNTSNHLMFSARCWMSLQLHGVVLYSIIIMKRKTNAVSDNETCFESSGNFQTFVINAKDPIPVSDPIVRSVEE